jgi:hypothetical protein
MSEVKVDTISERTAAGGVTIDGVLVKDGVATFQTAAGSPLVFEGATADAFETTFAITDPTADRTITFPDSSFTVPTAGGLFSSYAVISDEKSAATAGGTFTQDGWRTRDLNTEITDPDGIVSISSNEFTLAAGSYLIKWGAPARSVNNHKSRLYDVTGTATIEAGTSEYAYLHAYDVTPSIGYARVTPSGSNVYRIEHYCVLTRSTDGFGTATNVGEPEVYTIVEILKES